MTIRGVMNLALRFFSRLASDKSRALDGSSNRGQSCVLAALPLKRFMAFGFSRQPIIAVLPSFGPNEGRPLARLAGLALLPFAPIAAGPILSVRLHTSGSALTPV